MNPETETKVLIRALGALIAVVLLSGAGAVPLLLEEGSGFSVDLVPLAPMVVGHDLDVGMLVSGHLGDDAVARVQVSTPDGLQIAAADSSFSTPLVGAVPMHLLHVKAQRSGQYVLHARATVVQGGRERAVAEVALPVQVSGDTLLAGPRNWYRSELVEGDQRYRVNGQWLVPIDGPEEVDAADMLAEPVKPAIVKQGAARCPNCGASLESVRVLVVVDRSGMVRHAWAVGESRTGAAADTAQTAVARWMFAPARIGRTPVTDCMIVSVPIAR